MGVLPIAYPRPSVGADRLCGHRRWLSHSLGLKADGTLWAWGLNSNWPTRCWGYHQPLYPRAGGDRHQLGGDGLW